MGSIHHYLLIVFLQLLIIYYYTPYAHANHTCLPEQASALLQIKSSFLDPDLSSWEADTDCCHWEGISCDPVSGQVIALDLNDRGLTSRGLHPALFSLMSLQKLSLGNNDFMRSQLPTSGFERLAELIHLNLSYAHFAGQVPIGIARLTKLVSLDLSQNFDLELYKPSFGTLVANISNLEELYLDWANISSSGAAWSSVLAESVPRLEILSMVDCGLSGTIPEFFADNFSSLSTLYLGYNDFEGQFPPRILQLRNLKNLDVRYNSRLSVHLPDFSVASHLEGLYLCGTNFSSATMSPFGNFKSLKELWLDSEGITKELASSLAKLESLNSLQLYGSRVPEPMPSWIGSLQNLTELKLLNFKFSGPIPSWIGKFAKLTSLSLCSCNFSGTIPIWIGGLTRLKYLDVSKNNLSGTIPTWLGNLSQLQYLGLFKNNFNGIIPIWLENLTQLRYLDLSENNLSGTISIWLENLSQLRYLYLQYNNLSGTIPTWLGILTELRELGLSENNFSGTIPTWLGNLTRLQYLDLSRINLNGTIPTWLGNLTQLQSLDLSGNNLNGIIPIWMGNLTRLRELDLSENNLSGTIPNWLGNLTELRELGLSENNFSGEIPKSLFTLPALQMSFLYSNSLSGPLQEFSTLSSSIVIIDLSNNKLSGSIPKSFFQLRHLEILILDSNNLEGTLELSSFWTLRSLSWLSLSNNMLAVIDGEGKSLFPSFPKINCLDLASCNLKKLPELLRYQDEIWEIDLSNNQISGVIPAWIWETWKDCLEYLNLSHNMFTSVDKSPSLVPTHHLNSLDLSFNRLQGNVPLPLSQSHHTKTASQFLDYSNNKFSFILPNFTTYLSQTVYLNLSSNKLSGHIPASICSVSNLQFLDLSYNNFSGMNPSCLIEGGGMRVLKLRANYFDGMLFTDIRKGCNLQTIDLNDNLIEGTLPRSLSNCTNLEVLDVGNNHIIDTFPSWLGNLSKLQVLILRSNWFYGSVGSPPGGNHIGKHFSTLQIIDLASNNFTGNLYPQWFEKLESMMTNFNTDGEVLGISMNFTNGFYQDTVIVTFKGLDLTIDKILTAFKVIDFSNNAFDGAIPESIGRFLSLHGLNMSHNALTGHIPSQFGGLAQLESLDLSKNQLSGAIPEELTSLTYLAVVDLSFNNLSGRIPQGKQFSTFLNSSFEGNTKLCGSPLSKQCSNSSSTTPSILAASRPNGWSQDRIGYVLLFLFAGLGFGLGFATVILLQVICRNRGWNSKHAAMQESIAQLAQCRSTC